MIEMLRTMAEPPLRIEDADVKSTSELRRVKNPVINWNDNRRSFGDWIRPEYGFADIDRFSDADSYVLQSFKKKLSLFLKEGYTFTGRRPELVEYVSRRLSQIAFVSNITELQLVTQIYSNLSRYSNCFTAIVRDEKASGGYSYIDPRTNKRMKPIAGLFPLPAASVEVKVDDDSHAIKYRQFVSGSKRIHREYLKDDVLHFSINHREGMLVGTPRILPVLEDIRALRRIEENVELLVVQNIFPLIHYKVGTEQKPARENFNGMSEVDAVTQQIESMPPEGIYVTPERHEIKMIGTEGRALRVEEYLQYFKARVLAGLSMSSVDVGDGGAANRATADTMSRSLVDEVKSDQKLFEDLFYKLIIEQLLLESGESLDLASEEDRVYLRFNEIDYDAKVKKENHATQIWMSNGITHKEFREILGRNEMSEEEWQDSYSQKVTTALALVSGATAASSPLAYTAANSDQTPVESSDIKKAEAAVKAQAAQAAKLKAKTASGGQVANRNRPSNQYGTKSSSAKSIRQSIFDSHMDSLMESLPVSFDRETHQVLIRAFEGATRDKYKVGLSRAFEQGISSVADTSSLSNGEVLRRKQSMLSSGLDYVAKLYGDIAKIADNNELSAKDKAIKIEAIKYRLGTIDRTESIRAYNWGVLTGLAYNGETEYSIDIQQDSDPGEIELSGRVFSIANATMYTIPPWHPNSTIKVKRHNHG